MKKRLTRLPVILFFITILILTASWPAFAANEEKTFSITIIHTNDIHGRITDGIGFPKIFTKIEDLRKSNPNILLLDAGDPFHGLPIATVSQGKSMVEVMNALKYDAMALGNHDFDYGQERLLELKEMADFPILSANTFRKDGSNLLPSYIIKDFDGIRVAVFGLSSRNTSFETNPKNVEGLTFADPVAVAKEIVPQLERQADVIILLSHLGLDDPICTSATVAEEVPGIDIIIDGHSHTELKEGMVVREALINQTGAHLDNLGVVTLTVENDTITKRAQLFPKDAAANLVEDQEILTLIKGIQAETERTASAVIGKTAVKLNGLREDVRTGETNLGNLVTAAMLKATGADIAFTNGGGITGSIEAGDITVGDIIRIIPYGNSVITKEVKGSDLLAALERGVSSYPEPLGGFPHVAGMTFTFEPHKEPGSRVQKVNIPGNSLDPEKDYMVATNDFLAAGGDNYTMLAKGETKGVFASLAEIVADYVRELGTVNVTTDGRIKIAKAISQEAAPTKTPRQYTVKEGDILWRIAQQFGLTYQKLAQYNKLKNPHLILPGQKLLIPQQ